MDNFFQFIKINIIEMFIVTCSDSEVYRECGTACPLTCENKDNPPRTCTAQCVEGCFCKSSFVRNTVTGKCVLPKNCPPPSK